ncbi:ribbon-helix-helix protein, CopG family [Rathayibacter rathayi]
MTVRLTEEEIAALDARAAREHRSRSDIIRAALAASAA